MANEPRNIHGSLERSLSALTLGYDQGKQAHRESLYTTAGGDMQQVVMLDIQGRSWRKPVWSERNVYWEHPFFNNVDPSVGDSGLTNPCFAAGVELLTDLHLILDPQVRSWILNDDEWTVGARIRVVAWSPLATKKHKFHAKLHLTFSGWAAPSEDESGM